MPGINLGYAMTLPPKKAIAYFESKGYHIAFDTTAMEDAAHATGFTVSGILKQDVLADINGALGDALKNGQTLAQFKDNLQPVLARKGWIGGGLKADEDGVLEGRQLLPYRLDTIFRTNMQSAYMAGRYQRMMDNAQSRPYWEYDAVMDNRTRPAHAAMNGRVYRCDDPIWDTFFPPNGYNCRCSVRALNARDLSRHPIGLESSEGRLVTVRQPYGMKGQTRPVTAYKDPKTGQLFTPDAGFHLNAGKGYMGNLGQQMLRKGATVPPRIASQAAQAALGQPLMLTAFTADLANWMQQVHGDPALRGDWRYAGALSTAVLDALPEELPNAVVTLPGSAVRDAAMLTPDWLQLPTLLASPDVVLREPDGSLVYVIDQGGAPRAARVALSGGQPTLQSSWSLTPGDDADLKHLPIVTGGWRE
ncbi:phage head morphogenesis protein [Serratia marcescens]|uniref:Phage head morphogenesis protein n=1 Tax=Serratia marcescens TaxID=615 RepID=A0A5C7BVX4_SERMA|nr:MULTISPECIES: phage minor head protein [Serratia]TXE27144.1 phage head morphogenesis protein [Serratia marcescens]TXE55299.1 phage head morphogenesis protein [Serratia marcescens]